MIKLSKNNQAFAPVVIVIGLLIIGFITTVSSLLLQNKNLALTYKTRANEEWRCPGPDCDKCGRDGWWGSGCSTSPDAPTGAAPPSNSCPCEQKESCISGKWCGNDCAYHDDNDYRCTPNQPTVPAGAPSECNAPESCVGNRWCGNDLKFHKERNYKCQPQPPTPTGSRQCNAPESCVGKRWCGNDYSFHDDLNYIKNCAQKPSGTGANSYCTDGSQCTSGYCKDKYCAQTPTPTPIPLAAANTTSTCPRSGYITDGNGNCYYCPAPYTSPLPVEKSNCVNKKMENVPCTSTGYFSDGVDCWYCFTTGVSPSKSSDQSKCQAAISQRYKCTEPGYVKDNSGNCYKCLYVGADPFLVNKSNCESTSQINCTGIGVGFDKEKNQYIECKAVGQPPVTITGKQYNKKMKEAEDKQVLNTLRTDANACANTANVNQIFTINGNCYKCVALFSPKKIDCLPTPTPFMDADGSCICENGIWDGPDCYRKNREIYYSSCVDALISRADEEQIQRQLDIQEEKKRRCARECLGTCITTVEGHVKCVDYSSEKTTAQGQGSGGVMGGVGTSMANLGSRSKNCGYLFGKCCERVGEYDRYFGAGGMIYITNVMVNTNVKVEYVFRMKILSKLLPY